MVVEKEILELMKKKKRDMKDVNSISPIKKKE